MLLMQQYFDAATDDNEFFNLNEKKDNGRVSHLTFKFSVN